MTVGVPVKILEILLTEVGCLSESDACGRRGSFGRELFE
jgi:hypothetical protein